MTESRAALRYARAVLDLAIDRKVTEKVEQDMRKVVATIAESKALRNMLGSPVIKGVTKKEALLSIFSNIHEISEGLIALLVDNKRIPILNEVALKYLILNEDLKGAGVALVTTALPLTRDLEQKLLNKVRDLTGKEVTIENRIDESIIGGFVLRIGDLQYDASIANKLNRLKTEFTNTL